MASSNSLRSLWARATLAASLALAAVVLGRFSEGAMPAYFVLRPLAACIAFSLLLSAVVTPVFRQHSVLIAVLAALGIALWKWWEAWALAAVGVLAVLMLARLLVLMTGRQYSAGWSAGGTPALAFSAALFLVGVAQAVPIALADLRPVPTVNEPSQLAPNIYLVLLDGYPRGDTIQADFGAGWTEFSAALEDRGFDIYPDATTDTVWTELTLQELLTGKPHTFATTGPLDTEMHRAVRSSLRDTSLLEQSREIGYEFLVIDPPIGHVTFGAGEHIQPGGLNNFEDDLLRQSAIAPALSSIGGWPIADSLRDHMVASLLALERLAEPNRGRIILAHILAPHPPFLWARDGSPLGTPAYWPDVQLFEGLRDITGLSSHQYRDGMAGQLTQVNRLVLGAIDEIVATDPTAAVVLFSDHGARQDLDSRSSEWGKVLLAARTPKHPHLFAAEPHPAAILRILLSAYVLPVAHDERAVTD